jgi:hypothetical protein
VKKTNTLEHCTDHFQRWTGFFSCHVFFTFFVILLGTFVVRAEPVSIGQTNTDHAPSMTAWENDSVSNRRNLISQTSDGPSATKRFVVWLKERGNPWNSWRKPITDEATQGFDSVRGSRTLSVPTAVSEAASELQSIPIGDDVFAEDLPWIRQQDVGAPIQFSQNGGMASPPPVAAAEVREAGDRLDASVPEAVRGTSKLEFSSADLEGLHSDSSYEPDGGPGILTPPPQGPIPLIASPEPTVTALWGLSALLFACRRGARAAKR